MDEEEDASQLLNRFADSISSNCTSSLSCNASEEDGSRQELNQSPNQEAGDRKIAFISFDSRFFQHSQPVIV